MRSDVRHYGVEEEFEFLLEFLGFCQVIFMASVGEKTTELRRQFVAALS